MQVNPNPPANQQARAARLAGLKNDESEPKEGASNPVVRYENSIDGVLLNGQQESEYNAIQQQLQGNYTAVPRSHDRTVYTSSQKPLVGSEEWYKVRKDNHKEVERRRRETINRGIDELAKVVPECDKHKGQILQRSLEYIKKLKDNEQQYMEKLTLEKLMAEQVISELSNSNKKLKAELAQAWKEVDHWKRQAKHQ